MTTKSSRIVWTKIDEAPALATYSFLPIVQAFTRDTGVEIETSDISLAGRIIANFPEHLTPEQRIPGHLPQLGALAQHPDASIIKLPHMQQRLRELNLEPLGSNADDFAKVLANDLSSWTRLVTELGIQEN